MRLQEVVVFIPNDVEVVLIVAICFVVLGVAWALLEVLGPPPAGV